jgi:predicted ATPase/class 3 adenylate cyclase
VTLPSGTLTFLFTDIESSTQLWEQQPEAMRSDLVRHDELLRTVIEDHDGTFVKTTGDGLLAVFQDAKDAVAAAVAGQEAIGAETWNLESNQLRVRAALLTGTAEERDGDYYGTAVNRAARLMDAAHGGQILLSKTSQELVRDDLPDSVSILDLGHYRLKDVDRPEHVYQLVAPGLETDFPPLNALAVRLTNLPSQRTPFVGRQQEVQAVLDLLQQKQARLVTLFGPGGAGKTRLSVEIAETSLPDYSDGVFFVDLAPITNSELLPSAVANVLDIPEASGNTLNELIQRYLKPKQLLLVLDNFEHIVAAAELLPDWQQAAPDLTLLVTSREALNLREEWLYPVGGLPYPEDQETADLAKYGAVQLFLQTALRVRPDFDLEKEASGVVRICQLVEGLPLALELAASWTRTMDTRAIADEIQQNAEFLATRLRNVPERHRSMLAAFDYSWQQLGSTEESAFARLSVFRGGFDRTAVTAVTGANLNTLSALVDKSLLRWSPAKDREASGRYYVHELLRQFGHEKLAAEPGLIEEMRRNHGLYFTDLAHDLSPLMLDDRQLEFTSRITAEIENIRVAWQWAAEHAEATALREAGHAMAIYFQFVGRYTEGQTTFQKAVEALSGAEQTPENKQALAGLRLDLAYFQIRLGLLEEAQELAEKSWSVFERYEMQPQPGLGTDPRAALGILASTEGDYETTARYGEAVLRTSKADDNSGNKPFGAYLLTRAALGQGEYEKARQYAQEGYTMARQSGERWFLAYMLNEMGNVDLALGEYEDARNHYDAAMAIRRKFNDPEGIALAAVQLGAVALQEKQYDEAEKHFQQGLELYEEINDRGGLARALDGLARTAAATSKRRVACGRYRQALDIAVDIHFVPVILSLLEGVGEFFLELGDLEAGLRLLARAASHPRGEHETRRRAEEALNRQMKEAPTSKYEEIVEEGSVESLLPLAQNTQVQLERLEIESGNEDLAGKSAAIGEQAND